MRHPEASPHTKAWASLPARAGALIGLLLACGAAALAADVAVPSPPVAGTPEQGPLQPPHTPWLDEVRRQRKAWEERRQSAREAFDARRRRQDPRGAAQQQVWKDDIRRRREARREQMEQEREYYRNLPPYQDPPWVAPADPSISPLPTAPGLTREPIAPDTDAGPNRDPAAFGIIPPAEPAAPHTPPNWDNLWYYRGY